MNNLYTTLLIPVVISILFQTSSANPFSKVIGWADVPGNHGTENMIQTTNGGDGGKVVTVKSIEELNTLITGRKKDTSKLVIRIEGTITYTGEMIATNNCHNLTIEGTDQKSIIKNFGFYLRSSSNVIFRNLTFENCPDDAITIDGKQSPANHHIWVDHCYFSDLPFGSPANLNVSTTDKNNDGIIDIKNGSGYITISFCRFENHSKALLFSHTCDIEADKNMKVTVHHNWFGHVAQRATRNRSGKVHLFNNYYENTGTMLFPKLEKDNNYYHGYAIASVCGANVVVENNYFKNVIWASLVSRNSEKSVEWKQIYGMVGTLPHWCPTSNEEPGYLSYRGQNIQDPPAGTEITIHGPNSISQKYKIWPLDTTNPDPQNWNPWNDYGYSQEKINSILHKASDVPSFIKEGITTGIRDLTPQSPVKTNKTSNFNDSKPIYFDLKGRKVGLILNTSNQVPSVYISKAENGMQSYLVK